LDSSLSMVNAPTSVVPMCSCTARVSTPTVNTRMTTSKAIDTSAIKGISGATAMPAKNAEFSIASNPRKRGTASRRTATVNAPTSNPAKPIGRFNPPTCRFNPLTVPSATASKGLESRYALMARASAIRRAEGMLRA